jgi:hypothetical protein
MEVDWRKVAVSLNTDGHRDLETALRHENSNEKLEYRIRGFILISIADALFAGIKDDAGEASND